MGLLNQPRLARTAKQGLMSPLEIQMDTMVNDPLRPNLSSRLTQQDLVNNGLLAIGMAPMGITKAKTASGLLGNTGTIFKDIRPPKENINKVASSYSNAAKVLGNDTMPLANLKGGVGQEVGDNARVDKLVQQLKGNNAYLERLIVDDVGNVIEGQHRLDALRKLGVKDVPVVVIQDLERNFPMANIQSAMTTAQKMSSDHKNQLSAHLAEIYADEQGNLAEIAKYEPPQGFENAWFAALKTLASK